MILAGNAGPRNCDDSTRERRRLLLLVLLAGCAAGGELRRAELAAATWQREVRRSGVNPGEIRNPLLYTEEMRAAARAAVGAGSTLDKLRSLQRFMFDETRFTFDYDSRQTWTAIEAYRARQGNCVSFTNVFIALARSVGLPVRAALLTLPGNVERRQDLIVINNHVVAVYEHSGGATVFDFNRRRERTDVGLRLIDDMYITALYLNNLGVEHLLSGRAEAALRMLQLALRLAPDFAGAYGNLGVTHRKLGDEDGAFLAYRQALELDPQNPTILKNLAALYQSQGRDAEARGALLAADLRGATPYLLLIRGDLELHEGRVRRALGLYRQASRLSRKIPEIHLAIARAEIRRGHVEAARRALHRALEIDPGNAEGLLHLKRLEQGD